MQRLLILLAFFLLSCSGPETKTTSGSELSSSRCDAPHESCKQRCRKEADGAAQNVCFNGCLKRLKACQDGASY